MKIGWYLKTLREYQLPFWIFPSHSWDPLRLDSIQHKDLFAAKPRGGFPLNQNLPV